VWGVWGVCGGVGCVGYGGVGVWAVWGCGVTPYVRHSTDCTCCDFGHLRFIGFPIKFQTPLKKIISQSQSLAAKVGVFLRSVNAARNSKSSNVRNRPGPESFSQQSTLGVDDFSSVIH
jgi:hypothetical protein